MKTILIIFIALLFFNCEKRTQFELYNESYIEPGIKGVVTKTELWKGSVLKVYVNSEKEGIGVFNDYQILMQIKPNDSINKFKNSNKSYVKRNDSIFYFDTVLLTKLKSNLADSLSDVEKWDRSIINKWMKIK